MHEREVRFVNLTPHAVTVVGYNPIPPSGTVFVLR